VEGRGSRQGGGAAQSARGRGEKEARVGRHRRPQRRWRGGGGGRGEESIHDGMAPKEGRGWRRGRGAQQQVEVVQVGWHASRLCRERKERPCEDAVVVAAAAAAGAPSLAAAAGSLVVHALMVGYT